MNTLYSFRYINYLTTRIPRVGFYLKSVFRVIKWYFHAMLMMWVLLAKVAVPPWYEKITSRCCYSFFVSQNSMICVLPFRLHVKRGKSRNEGGIMVGHHFILCRYWSSCFYLIQPFRAFIISVMCHNSFTGIYTKIGCAAELVMFSGF